MEYFKDDKNNVYAYEESAEEFILDGLTKITEKEALAIVNPPPTQDELVANAKREKQGHIDQTNDYMNSKQWPGKAAIGRLNGDELAQYNLWLDYLDALEAVDISNAPDIDWPTAPGEQTS